MLVTGATAYAARGQETEPMGIMTLAFLGFFAVVIVMQLIPGIVLFFSMVYGLFSANRKVALPATGEEQESAN